MSVEYGFSTGETDTAPMKALWQAVFGDEAAVTDAFFGTLYTPGSALLAQENGALLGGAHLLRGIQLLSPGEQPRAAVYLYALGVREDSRGRGIGRELVERCVREAEKRGEILCLMPGSDSLRAWYKTCCGMTNLGGLRRESFAADRDGQRVTLTAISPAEYTEQRETLLKDLPHARLPDAYFRFQAALCGLSGGGFFRLRDDKGGAGIVCATPETDGVYACEMLYTGDAKAAAHAIAQMFGRKSCRALLPGTGSGLMSAGGKNSPCFWWGPLLD